MSVVDFPIPTPKQELALRCPAAEILFGGARGGGKSWCSLLKIVQHDQLYGQYGKVLVLRRYLKDLRDFMQLCRRFLTRLGWREKIGEKEWYSPKGLLVRFQYLENEKDAEQYQGHEYTLIIIEEAGQYPTSEVIDLLNGALRSGAGVPSSIYMTANPGGVGNDWLRERFVDPAPEGFTMIPIQGSKAYRYFIPSLLADNPELLKNDPEYIDRLNRSGPPHLVEAWVRGDWYAAPTGDVFKYEYFQNYFDPSDLPKFRFVLQSWDTAFKKGKKNDRSACTTWGLTKSEIYLLDGWAGKVTFPELKERAKLLNGLWNPHIVLVEDKASGQSLYQELKDDSLIPVKAVSVDGDKLARAYSVTPVMANNKILLPNDENSFVYHYLAELCAFPKGKYDDYVDSTSQALDFIRAYKKKMERLEKQPVRFTQSLWSV